MVETKDSEKIKGILYISLSIMCMFFGISSFMSGDAEYDPGFADRMATYADAVEEISRNAPLSTPVGEVLSARLESGAFILEISAEYDDPVALHEKANCENLIDVLLEINEDLAIELHATPGQTMVRVEKMQCHGFDN